MWGSDYPHLEGTSPFSNEAIRRTFAGVEPSEVQAMLAGNAAALYGFDLDALEAGGWRTGPGWTTSPAGLKPFPRAPAAWRFGINRPTTCSEAVPHGRNPYRHRQFQRSRGGGPRPVRRRGRPAEHPLRRRGVHRRRGPVGGRVLRTDGQLGRTPADGVPVARRIRTGVHPRQPRPEPTR